MTNYHSVKRVTNPNKIASSIYHWVWSFLDLIFPPNCASCGIAGTRWCGNCKMNTREISPPICMYCGTRILKEGICSRCKDLKPQFDVLRSYAFFDGPIRKAIHKLKYSRDILLGETLAQPLISMFKLIDWQVDCIVPVPLSIDRLGERGYNQASLIAFPMALACGVPYKSQALRKIINTPSQVGKTIEERRVNVVNAFIADEKSVKNKSILVIDDVCTSCATLNECARVLKHAGAKTVYAMTVARASFV